MPIYKGAVEVTSGNLYKGSTEIENAYKGSDSLFVNEISISFLNFPGQADYVITGSPGSTISVTKSVSWTVTASSGSAFNGTQTASGVPSDFAFTGGANGSISNTTSTLSVNFVSSVFPNNDTSVDYSTLTLSLPTTTIATYSYTFTGGLARSTSCTTFAGTSCGVTSATAPSAQAGYPFEYWNSNASGTGGFGANSCSQGCSVSISSSGGSSGCNTNGATSTASISGVIIGCGELNTFSIATDTFKAGPVCAHGNNIAFYAGSTLVSNIVPNNSGNYNQTVISNAGAQSYLGQYVIGYAKGSNTTGYAVTGATYGGGNYLIPNPCPSS